LSLRPAALSRFGQDSRGLSAFTIDDALLRPRAERGKVVSGVLGCCVERRRAPLDQLNLYGRR
jgi:hypothetical protein